MLSALAFAASIISPVQAALTHPGQQQLSLAQASTIALKATNGGQVVGDQLLTSTTPRGADTWVIDIVRRCNGQATGLPPCQGPTGGVPVPFYFFKVYLNASSGAVLKIMVQIPPVAPGT